MNTSKMKKCLGCGDKFKPFYEEDNICGCCLTDQILSDEAQND